jgi:DNA-binding HxlR family transcriptional regulator
MSIKNEGVTLSDACRRRLRSIQDTMDIIGGKWKIRIIGTLAFGKNHFLALQRQVEGIGAKMLSKELQELEFNGLVKRTVHDTKPVTVTYELTAHGETIMPIIDEIAKWGELHREKILRG